MLAYFSPSAKEPFTDESPRFLDKVCAVRSTTMHLYQLTLQQASQITHTVHGNFTGTKSRSVLPGSSLHPAPAAFFLSHLLKPTSRVSP